LKKKIAKSGELGLLDVHLPLWTNYNIAIAFATEKLKNSGRESNKGLLWLYLVRSKTR
jgi:hypothetical protein